MAYKIETIDRENYIHIIFFGDWLKGEGDRILDDIFATVVASGHLKALVDYRESYTMDSDTMMDFKEASKAAKLPNVKMYKFAVLFKPSDFSRFLFWETVAVNRGIHMKCFQNEKDARRWLIK